MVLTSSNAVISRDWEVLIQPPYLGVANFVVVVATGAVVSGGEVVFVRLAGAVVVVPPPHAVITMETSAVKHTAATAALLFISLYLRTGKLRCLPSLLECSPSGLSS